MTDALALHGVSVGYGDRPVVHGVDLTVPPGQVVALLGANGSGKTTLVRGVLGLADVLAGRIEVLGQPLADVHPRARVGYVPQRHTVAGAVPSTVHELVMSGRLSRQGFWGRASGADRVAVQDAIEEVDLADRGRTNVAELSGGQQRRVLIARALAGDPELLVMDEPTAGVDRASQTSLVRTLTALVQRGLTLVVVTHEVGPLVPILDRVLVLDEGRLVHDGPWEPRMLGAADGLPTEGQHHGSHDEPPATGWASALGGPWAR